MTAAITASTISIGGQVIIRVLSYLMLPELNRGGDFSLPSPVIVHVLFSNMEQRWTYARIGTPDGSFSAQNLLVLLNGEPVGWVRYYSAQPVGSWHWCVTMTRAHGNCAEKMDALNELRDSLTADLQQPL